MNVLIIGAGRRGLRLAKHLIEEDKNVTFLDSNSSRCLSAVQKLDCMSVCGSATDVEKLIEAGCEEADAVIAVTDSDEVNLVSCGIIASQFPNVATTIAAIRSISYLGDGVSKPILGISHIVNPDQEAALRILGVLRSGLYRDVITFPDSHFLLFTTQIEKGSRYTNMKLIDLKKKIPGEYVVTSIRRRGRSFTPSGDTVINAGDEIAIIVDDDESKSLFNELRGGIYTGKINRILLVGATKISRYLLNLFTPAERKKVILVEKDEEQCKEFVELFRDILVLNGSITDEGFWEDENLSKSDLMISVTENDELNIITSLYAKSLGVKRVISLIKTNNNYITLADHLDIDASISTTNATVDALVKYLRGRSVETLHTLFDGDIEVYEFNIQEDFKHLGKALKDVNLKGKAIIAGIRRANGENFIPTGMYEFRHGDTVLVAAAHAEHDFVQEFFS